ncbi:MAG TPA: DUF2252 family protein [Halothiobacillus sp.]|nr:DUF2252 family protein [Halothiobacillus sp.]
MHIKQPQWKSEAHRVVGVQQRMQSVSMAFLHAVMMGKQSYVLRALQPSEDRVDLSATVNAAQMIEGVLRHMGELVAWGQLRSSGRAGSSIADELIDFAQKKKWQKSLMDLAQQCKKQVEKDYLSYAEAFDDGAFEER